MFGSLEIDGSGMTANKEWMNTISNNIANINTTRTNSGGPYKRQSVIFEPTEKFDSVLNQEVGDGVRVSNIVQDNGTQLKYDPTNPDANPQGYVAYPDIDLTAEMSDLLAAERGYEASSSTLTADKKVLDKEDEIGRV